MYFYAICPDHFFVNVHKKLAAPTDRTCSVKIDPNHVVIIYSHKSRGLCVPVRHVNNINNEVIIWLITQKQLSVLFRKKPLLHVGPMVEFIIVTHLHTKHTKHKRTELRCWTSVSLLSKGNMSAPGSRSEASSPCC